LQSGRPVRTAIASCFGRAVLFGVSILACASIVANAAPVRIVAIGASNTHGWYVGNQGAARSRPATASGVLLSRNSITGSAGCCARVKSGHQPLHPELRTHQARRRHGSFVP